MTKKGHQKYLAYETRKFFGEKVKLEIFFVKSAKFSKIGRKSETGGGNASLSQGDGRPCWKLLFWSS